MIKDKTKNQVNVLHIFKENGVWMFNDEEVGLYKEPFVPSINPMIETYVRGRKEFTAFISKDPMYDVTLTLNRVDDKIEGVYEMAGSGIVGWLCPALLKYFEGYPKNIYVKIEL